MTILNVIDWGEKNARYETSSLFTSKAPCCSVGSAVRADNWGQLTRKHCHQLEAHVAVQLINHPPPPPLLTEHNALIIHALFQVWIIQKSGSRRAQTVGDHSTHSRMFSLPENPAAHPPSVAAAPSLCCCPPRSTDPDSSLRKFYLHMTHILTSSQTDSTAHSRETEI